MRNKYWFLIVLMMSSFIAGLYMLITPEKVNLWIIRIIGLLWIMESFSCALDIIKKYLDNKFGNLTKPK